MVRDTHEKNIHISTTNHIGKEVWSILTTQDAARVLQWRQISLFNQQDCSIQPVI